MQQIWQRLSADDNKYYHELIIAYCDQAVTLRLQNRIDLALSTLYKGYELIKYNGLKNKEAFIIKNFTKENESQRYRLNHIHISTLPPNYNYQLASSHFLIKIKCLKRN